MTLRGSPAVTGKQDQPHDSEFTKVTKVTHTHTHTHSKKVMCNEDRRLMQEDLESIYEWARKNKMQFNGKKFEQIIHGSNENTSIEPYKSPSGDPITIKNTVKDLGVLFVRIFFH